ncbi:NAD(P)/FAD-dependent oxidoreductase [Halosegnis marinus]|uniref:NAD(P)/FAD-dependent oxidoreductase n=1 Tax=Halosegnis marinus TaxID=3034023 RepID=A0ABD5ZKX7_9EURY|nr:NAD(P)/FAD-dependent oxidoreductase [Halosegnis sp. DT85]
MIAVVGGGVAGLAAAYRLQQAGYEPTVFEASDSVGGLAATYETAGDPIEAYYHHLSATEETIVELAEELGVADRLEWRWGHDSYYVEGVVHPLNTAWEIAAYPYLSFYDKFRLGMLTLGIDVRGGLPSFDTYDDLESFEHVPIKEFLLDHTTQGVYDYFFEPLLRAKFGSRAEDVSAAWLLGRIKFRGERDLTKGEKLGYFEGSFAVLLDALVEEVGRENVVTGARVQDIGFGESVESLTVERDGDVTEHAVEDAVVTTMPHLLERWTGYACDIDFQGSVCAVVTMEEAVTDTYWLNIADEAPFGALIEHTNFVPPERYGGDHLLYCASYVQNTDEPLWNMDDDELEEHWLSGVEEMFPEFSRDAVTDFRVSRNPRTAPIYERGYLDMVVPYDLGDEVADGLYYAGMASRAQYPERSLNGGIVAGYEAADLVAENRR